MFLLKNENSFDLKEEFFDQNESIENMIKLIFSEKYTANSFKNFIREFGRVVELENRNTDPDFLVSIESVDILFEIGNYINSTSPILFEEDEL